MITADNKNMPRKLVVLKNLSLSRNKRLLLKNVNFSLEEGQKWFLYGTNEAEIIFSLLSGLIRDYSGQISCLDMVPADRSPQYYRQVCFVPSYFPRTAISTGSYISHYRKFYPETDTGRIGKMLDYLNISRDDNIKKLSFSKRKLFHIILGLSRDPSIIMIQDLYQGLAGQDRCDIHNLIRNCRTENKCIIYFGGKLSDFRDMADNIAAFSNGVMNGYISLADLARKFQVMQTKSRRYSEKAVLSSIRLTRGWKVLYENHDSRISPPDFDLIRDWLDKNDDPEKYFLAENITEGREEEEKTEK